MDTKNVKDIKITNADTVKVMANKEIWWQKNLWHPITIRHNKGDSWVSIDNSEYNKYVPFRVIKVRFTKEAIQKYGTPHMFLDGDTYDGRDIRAESKYNSDQTEVTFTFASRIKRITLNNLEFGNYNLNSTSDDVNKVANMQIFIVE